MDIEVLEEENGRVVIFRRSSDDGISLTEDELAYALDQIRSLRAWKAIRDRIGAMT